jgi:CRP/FNR family cyclic AMP-dependent transcriptional regulator
VLNYREPMQEMIDLTAGLPERTLAVDELLVVEGEAPDHLYVLLEGELVVRRGGDDLIAFDQPGACIGEKAVLLGRPHSSSVVAVQPSTVRVIEGAADRIHESPEVLLSVATLLASRLEMVEAFLSDLQHQYRDVDGGLGMISEVLGALAHHHGPKARPGSDRDPDPLY